MSLEVIKPPTKEVLEKVRSEYDLNERRIKEAIEHLRDWLELQPHLPKEIDDARLERWLIRCKNSTEKVKRTLDLYYSLRIMVPDVMTGWDTKSDWFKIAKDIYYCITMPQLTPDCDRVSIFGFLTSDTKNFDMLDYFKLCQMLMEVRNGEDYYLSDIYIFDMANYTLQHVPKITLTHVKKYELCSISGYNTRIKALHILNAGPWAEALIAMIRLVFKSKLVQRIQVHGKDWSSFYKEVPKEILPTEYGGTSGSIAENWNRWTRKFQSYHDVFLERQNYKSDESKRSGPPIGNDLLGFEGSFRKLDVD